MKLLLFVVAAVVSTVNAEDLAPCSIDQLLPITNSPNSTNCAMAAKFNIAMAALTETPPSPEQYPLICASPACKEVLNQLYTAVPTDCALRSGKSLKSLTDPVKNACPAPLHADAMPSCTLENLVPKLVWDVAADCREESGNNVGVTAISGPPPTSKEITAMCASNSCRTLLHQIYAAGCKVHNAEFLKCD